MTRKNFGSGQPPQGRKVAEPDELEELAWAAFCQGEVDAVNKFFDWLKAALNLPQWEIILGEEPAEPGHSGECKTMEFRYVAEIHLSKLWLTLPYADQAYTMVHETLHICHERVSELVRSDLADLTPKGRQGIYDYLYAKHRVDCERMVDALATGLVKSLGAVEVWNETRRDCGVPADDEITIAYIPTPDQPDLKVVAASRTRPRKK